MRPARKIEMIKTTRATASMMHAPMLPCAEYSMELAAQRLAVKAPSNFEH
jgi:hypothetical protein